MKTYYLIPVALLMSSLAMSQVNNFPDNIRLANDAENTLKAATSMCAVSFLYEATGAGLILSGMEMDTDAETGILSIGLFLGTGGVGMATNNLILAARACKQIQMLNFNREDSSLRMRMLKNIKTARTLARIQNVSPIIGLAAGIIGFSVSKSKSEYEQVFYESPSFWIPVVSICCAGLVLTIPEIVLIENTRADLKTYQRKLTFGKAKYGMGISYNF